MTRENRQIPAAAEDFGIKILKNGTWLHQGRPIRRHNLVKLFSTVLKRDKNGDYWLETPAERGRIEVEDAPFLAVELRVEASGAGQNLLFRTNVDDWVTAGPDHPLRFDAAPYVLVRGNLEARLTRAVYYELMGHAAPGPDGGLGVESGGAFFKIAGAMNENE